MDKYRLIYFAGCPNHLPSEELLRRAGIRFESVCQDDLVEADPFKNYTSPTLICGEKIIFGSEAIGGGCSMPLPNLEQLLKLL